MLPYFIWFWGSFLQALQWWCSHDVLCNSCEQGVIIWSRSNLFSQLFIISPSVHFEMMFIWSFQVLFHVIFNHPSPKSPLTYCHMLWGWFPTFVAPSLRQIHRHYSVSGIDVLLSRWLNSVNCFDWSCHITMLLTPNPRLRPNPLNVNKCIWSWWRVVITFI